MRYYGKLFNFVIILIISNMKIYLRLFLLVLIAVMVGYSNWFKKECRISSLILQNIEALAEDESYSNIYCFSIGSVDCPIDHSKVEYVFSSYGL